MRKVLFLFSTLLILISCGNQNKEKQFESLLYTKLKYPMSYFAKTDSGFILKVGSTVGYKYFEYAINKDEIKMYGDSLYNLYFGISILYPTEFYVNHLGGFRNRANCELKPTGKTVNERYVYRTSFLSFNSPEFRTHIKGVKFRINGNKFEIEMDSMEVRTLLPIFEPTLYAAKGM